MGSFSWNSNVVYGSEYSRYFDGFSPNVGFRMMGRGGSSSSSSLVLDSEKGELVKAPARLGPKAMSEAKAIAALKSHSEAERRRRERINAHLSTLRKLVPCSDKMDKASLLAEVISHVKELKRNATEATKGSVIPMDNDELIVEPHGDGSEGGSVLITASLCCDYRPELLADIRQALDSLHLKTVRAEISTLGSRVKNVFVMTSYEEGGVGKGNGEVCHLVSSIKQALNSVLEKASSPEFSPGITLSNKRRRVSPFDHSSSSSS
ncbi:PREDICTED: transcription factor bHLH30-like [Nelumbo nucifera]|uniref:Transcription factor bHLH30-like n=1 Tax=Nelumbo nucifera TaxID=4432 RepID=A0A1U8B9C4_NELNU|nr:PREDICTED: transcription factor bHLH30-like [Nelumbo nucifera]